MKTLTAKETAALPVLIAASAQNGHDFGLVENVKWDGDRKALGGIISSLCAKGVISDLDTVTTSAGTFTQFVLCAELVESLTDAR